MLTQHTGMFDLLDQWCDASEPKFWRQLVIAGTNVPESVAYSRAKRSCSLASPHQKRSR